MPSMSESGDDIEVVADAVSLAWVRELAARRFGDMVKAVVDVETGVMAIGASSTRTKSPSCSSGAPGRADFGGSTSTRTRIRARIGSSSTR
jgi:hypothetical protein